MQESENHIDETRSYQSPVMLDRGMELVASDIKSQQRSRPREEDIKLIKRNQQSEHKGKKE